MGNMYPPHDLGGGYELTWRSSVRHLLQRGHTVRVLTSDYRAPGVTADETEDVRREFRSYWRDHAFPRLSWRQRIALERHNAGTLERHLDELRPDIVNWWGMGSMSLGLVERVRRAGIPAVGVVGDEWMVWGPRADGWIRPFRGRDRLARLAERLTGLPARAEIGRAAIWLFNSASVRERAGEAGWELAAGRVLHPGIDDCLFSPRPTKPWSWRLLYLGRLDPRKGVDLAVDALALLPEASTLVLQGSGDQAYVDELRARCRDLGVHGRTRFQLLPRAELKDVYAEADVVLFPTQWDEPWGLVPLEAMAVGRPVVASGSGGSAEYLRDGENCLIYRPRASAEALAEAVRRLAADPSLRSDLREAGLRTSAKFTETAYNEGIEATLQEAAKGTGRTAG